MACVLMRELAQVIQEVSIQRLVEARGVALAPHGAALIGRCPEPAPKNRTGV